MPLPVWNNHSGAPLRASSATNSPVARPAKTSPPAVVSSEATTGCSVRHDQTSAPVSGSKALTKPSFRSRRGSAPPPQYGRLSLNPDRAVRKVAHISTTGT